MTLLPYELAKELKDTGWPQPFLGSTEFFGEWVHEMSGPLTPTGNRAYSPSLSELIAACPALIELEDHIPNKTAFNLYADIQGDGWWAEYPAFDNLSALKETPEIAVAYLWLALKKEGIV